MAGSTAVLLPFQTILDHNFRPFPGFDLKCTLNDRVEFFDRDHRMMGGN